MIMYICYPEDISEEHTYTYGDLLIALNEKGDIIGTVHENDGEWRAEYFNPILKKVGLDVKRLNDEQIVEFDVANKLKKYVGF